MNVTGQQSLVQSVVPTLHQWPCLVLRGPELQVVERGGHQAPEEERSAGQFNVLVLQQALTCRIEGRAGHCSSAPGLVSHISVPGYHSTQMEIASLHVDGIAPSSCSEGSGSSGPRSFASERQEQSTLAPGRVWDEPVSAAVMQDTPHQLDGLSNEYCRVLVKREHGRVIRPRGICNMDPFRTLSPSLPPDLAQQSVVHVAKQHVSPRGTWPGPGSDMANLVSLADMSLPIASRCGLAPASPTAPPLATS